MGIKTETEERVNTLTNESSRLLKQMLIHGRYELYDCDMFASKIIEAAVLKANEHSREFNFEKFEKYEKALKLIASCACTTPIFCKDPTEDYLIKMHDQEVQLYKDMLKLQNRNILDYLSICGKD